MPDKDSVTGWLQGLQAGDHDAADALWTRYFERLVRLARQRLGESPRRMADEEDVAMSVFKSLCEGVEGGEFERLHDREDFWRLIVTITARKANQHVRWLMRQKRGGGQVRGDSVFLQERSGHEAAGFDGFAGGEPTPEFLAQLTEEHQRLMSLLPDETLRQIARWKMDGWLTTEIAAQLQITTRSIERKVQRIREIWKDELSA
jgi:DNA-directed RNA polymerase specialized sigma24 family protein